MKQSKQVKALITAIPETDWTTVEDYPDSGEAQIAETKLAGFRLIVRRTRLVGDQAELWPDWRHHCFATNRNLRVMVADIDHRDHAAIEPRSATSKTRRSRTSPAASTPRTAHGL